MTFNSQVTVFYCTCVIERCLSCCLIIFRSLYVAVKSPVLCSGEHNEMLRGDRAQYVWAPVLFQAPVRMVVWIQEWGLEEWGHMGCYNPVEDVSTYKGCELCQVTAPCCQLARPALHIEHLSCSGPSESASQWIIYVLAPTSSNNACMTHILQCTVRKFRSQTNISAEWKCLSSALFAAVMDFLFWLHQAAKQPPSLFPLSLSQTDVFIVWLRCRGLTGKKKKAHSLYHLATPHQTSQDRMEWRGCLLT